MCAVLFLCFLTCKHTCFAGTCSGFVGFLLSRPEDTHPPSLPLPCLCDYPSFKTTRFLLITASQQESKAFMCVPLCDRNTHGRLMGTCSRLAEWIKRGVKDRRALGFSLLDQSHTAIWDFFSALQASCQSLQHLPFCLEHYW